MLTCKRVSAALFSRNSLLLIIFALLSIFLVFIPSGFEKQIEKKVVRCRGEVISVDNSQINQMGMVKSGDQRVILELLNGPFKSKVLQGNNPLLGQMSRDKIFEVGDLAFVILSLDNDGNIIFVNPQEHFRLGWEVFLFSLFVLLLLIFAGWTGVRALISFIFTALVLWKILVPLLLKGYDPVALVLGIATLLSAAVIFLISGPNRKGVVAFSGAFLGILTSCLMSLFFTSKLHIHGAVLPFSETLLYSGYGHLNLTHIYIAAIFLAASGAVMDLAMDIATSMDEIVRRHPRISRYEIIKSGLIVGRAVVGTMTTTLLLAYSGSYITLLMAFMAQGIPLVNTFNLIYVASELLKTLVGSFGLVTVAPFTAIMGGFLYSSCKVKLVTDS